MFSVSIPSDVSALEIHSRACEIADRYKSNEADLIEILQEVDEHRVYVLRGHASLFVYVVQELKLSESVAYNLIAVARKAREVPELQASLRSGAISLSNARKIAPILTLQNKQEWIANAENLSNRQLEKEIVKVRPVAATPERASYVTPERIRLEVGLSEKDMLQLRRAQDLLCQSSRRAVSLEETVKILTRDFLKRNDPLEKAKRHQVRKGPAASDRASPTPKIRQKHIDEPVTLQVRRRAARVPLSAHIRHQVNLRDGRRCVHVLENGKRCNQTRWLEIHHKVPVRVGGENAPENLVTLCAAHHRFEHL